MQEQAREDAHTGRAQTGPSRNAEHKFSLQENGRYNKHGRYFIAYSHRFSDRGYRLSSSFVLRWRRVRITKKIQELASLFCKQIFENHHLIIPGK